MAIYRQVYMSFWTDTKVHDKFSAEDKFFYLYLLTNSHTTLSGCYEISVSQMSQDTGKTVNEVEILLKRMINIHNVIRYNTETNEVLILNWYKYNWNDSPKLRKGVLESVKTIKNADYKEYVISLLENGNAPELPEEVLEAVEEPKVKKSKKSNSRTAKHCYGENKKVLMTDEEYNKLVEKFGEDMANEYITFLDETLVEKGYKYKSHYMVIAKKGSWVVERVNQLRQKRTSNTGSSNQFYNLLMEA